MVLLRNFRDSDAEMLQQKHSVQMTLEETKAMIADWNKKDHASRYFEMFAIIRDEELVGLISLYQLSESMVSCGPEIFACYRRQNIGGEAMMLAMEVAKGKGYKMVLQQIRVDNTASIALHNRIGFETDGYIYRNKKGNEVLIYAKSLLR